MIGTDATLSTGKMLLAGPLEEMKKPLTCPALQLSGRLTWHSPYQPGSSVQLR